MNEQQVLPSLNMFLFCQLIFRLILLATLAFACYLCVIWKIHHEILVGFNDWLQSVINVVAGWYVAWKFINKLWMWAN